MAPLDQALALLGQALQQPLRREEIVAEFQALVWRGLGPAFPKDVREVLADLAYDLDYFEASPAIRKEDPSYYGHERLEKEICDALRRLGDLGVEVAPYEGHR